MEYRHGPISIAAPGRLVWHFGPDTAGLRAEVERTGAIFVDNDLDPMVDLVLAQRLAVAIARRRGAGSGPAPQPHPVGDPGSVTRPATRS